MTQKTITKPWPAGTEITVFSGVLIDKDPRAAGWVKAALFGHADDLHSDVFDEKTNMQIKLVFRDDGVELSAPQLAATAFNGSAYLRVSELDAASREEFVLFAGEVA